MSFRLLTYLNSPWFGLRQNIQSIDHAIKLLGWEKLKSWLRAVLIVDAPGNENLERSTRNLHGVELVSGQELHPYHLLWCQKLLISRPAIERLQEALG